MRLTPLVAIVLSLTAGTALGQNPPANNGPNNKAINSKDNNNPGAPVAGANSSLKAKLSPASRQGATPTLATYKRTTAAYGVARP